jgi:hypothetical protein
MKTNKDFIVLLLIGLIVLLLISSGVYMYQNKKEDQSPQTQTGYQASGYDYKGVACEKVIPASSIELEIRDRIQTKGLGAVSVTPAGVAVSKNQVTQPIGSFGIITEGPTIISQEGDCYASWKVDFETGPDGWIGQTILVKVDATTIAPTQAN